MAIDACGGVQLSFCIPVYNVKPYIQDCIESILAQKLDSFEIICVDDCSTDGSYDELHRIADTIYPELITLKNEKNSGVGVTRNQAIKHATGKYIWLLDPDDLLVPGTVSQFLIAAEENEAEVLWGDICFFIDYDGSVPKEISQGTGSCRKADFSSPGLFYSHDQNGTLSHSTLLGLYNRDFLVRNNILYEENMPILEDWSFCFVIGMKTDRFFHIDLTAYLYRIRAGSATRRSALSDFRRHYECAKRALEIYRMNSADARAEYAKSVEAHFMEMKESAALYLAAILDAGYIKQELRELKKAEYYPYKHKDELAFCYKKKRTAFVVQHLLPHEPTFWLFHLMCVGRYHLAKIINRKKK